MSGSDLAQLKIFRLGAVDSLNFEFDRFIEAREVKKPYEASGPIASNKRMGLTKWEWSLIGGAQS
jgi:hypothetical protein